MLRVRNWLLANLVVANVAYFLYRLLLVLLVKRRKVVSVNTIVDSGRKDKLAIIGCGSSINNLPEDLADKLADYDIAALSYAALLPVQIDYYFYEVPRGVLCKEHEIFLYPELKAKLERGDIKHFLLKNAHSDEGRFDTWFPDVSVVMTFAIHLISKRKLSFLLRCICKLGLEKHFLFQSRASIFSTCLWAGGVGYSEILLVGVDLRDSSYFYEFDNHWLEKRIPNPFVDDGLSRDCLHPTAGAMQGLGLKDTMEILKSLQRVSITVENPNSLLAEIFPVNKL